MLYSDQLYEFVLYMIKKNHNKLDIGAQSYKISKPYDMANFVSKFVHIYSKTLKLLHNGPTIESSFKFAGKASNGKDKSFSACMTTLSSFNELSDNINLDNFDIDKFKISCKYRIKILNPTRSCTLANHVDCNYETEHEYDLTELYDTYLLLHKILYTDNIDSKLTDFVKTDMIYQKTEDELNDITNELCNNNITHLAQYTNLYTKYYKLANEIEPLKDSVLSMQTIIQSNYKNDFTMVDIIKNTNYSFPADDKPIYNLDVDDLVCKHISKSLKDSISLNKNLLESLKNIQRKIYRNQPKILKLSIDMIYYKYNIICDVYQVHKDMHTLNNINKQSEPDHLLS